MQVGPNSIALVPSLGAALRVLGPADVSIGAHPSCLQREVSRKADHYLCGGAAKTAANSPDVIKKKGQRKGETFPSIFSKPRNELATAACSDSAQANPRNLETWHSIAQRCCREHSLPYAGCSLPIFHTNVLLCFHGD